MTERHKGDVYGSLADQAEQAPGVMPAIPSATVVLLRDASAGPEVLMLRKNSEIAFGGMWVFPGGKIDDADRAAADDELGAAQVAAARETLEETGWTVRVTGLLGLYINQAFEHTTYHRHAFIAEPVSHDPDLPLDRGIEDAVWLSWEELIQQKDRMRSEAVLKCFEDYRAGKHYPLDFIYDFNHPENGEA